MGRRRSGKFFTACILLITLFHKTLAQGAQDDPNRMVHHVLQDISCKFNNFYMECISLCTQKQEVETIWNAKFENEKNIIKLIHNYTKKNPGAPGEGFNCNAKCQTNPVATTCESKCRPDWSYIDNCDDECKDPTIAVGDGFDFTTSGCKTCIEKNIKHQPEYCAEHYPGRRQKCVEIILQTCPVHQEVTQTKRKSDFTECIGTRQMEADFQQYRQQSQDSPCYVAGTGYVDSVKCDNFLKRYLWTKPCLETCDNIPGAVDNPFGKCLDECHTIISPPLCNQVCDYLRGKGIAPTCRDNCFPQTPTQPPPTNPPPPGPPILPCISKCDARVKDKTKFDRFQGKTWSQYLSDRCMAETLNTLKRYIDKDPQKDTVFPTSDLPDYVLILKRLTPNECFIQCGDLNATAKDDCIKEFCKTDLTDEQLKQACDEDPYRRKYAVLYAAANGKSLKTSDIEISYNADFKDYLIVDNNTISHGFVTSLIYKFLEAFDVPPSTSPLTCGELCSDRQFSDDVATGNAECQYNCYKSTRTECVFKPDETVELTRFSTCRWIVDLSLSNSPDEVTASYFNEKVFYDQKDKLLRPNSHQYLQEVEDQGSKGFFVFPYFLIIRAACDGGYYDEAFYQLFMHGGSPSVVIQHWPTNPRDPFHVDFKGTFRGALVNLTRIANHVLIPSNPLHVQHGTQAGCHWELCYPGFAVPLLLYKIPNFEVLIEAQDIFDKLQKKIYVSAYNSRDVEGAGALIVTNATKDSRLIAVRKNFFPKKRTTRHTDTELQRLDSCLGETSKGATCPYLYVDEDDPSFPLDGDDFFMPQLTFGSAPTVAIAGLYDPGYLIFGDPDMHTITLLQWTLDNPKQNQSILSGIVKTATSQIPQKFRCLQFDTVVAGGYVKPMYTQVDTSDIEYPINYYRRRFKPKQYEDGRPTQAIFDVISLVDRLLLVTARGLVNFYGNTNATLNTNTLFEAPDEDRLEHCFKFVRSAQRGGMENDLVIGVTYDYLIPKDGSTEQISQQIHVGELKAAGDRMEWTQIVTDTSLEDNEEVVPLDTNAGKIVTLDPRKHGGVPLRELEANVKSEVERICMQAYREQFSETLDVIIKDTYGWCVALDATPAVTQQSTVMLLIRMRVAFVGRQSTSPTGSQSSSPQDVYFYILASHTLRGNKEDKVVWNIRSVIPRIPCPIEHREGVPNVPTLNNDYFTKEGTNADTVGTVIGCHNINKWVFSYVYVTRMTFTRMLSTQLFLFGSCLLLSTDAGETFVYLDGFPDRSENPSDKEILRHRITVMAFDDKGHFAFLTSKRELWIGSTGDLKQIRIRPSKGYSMIQTVVSTVSGLQDAVPFSVMYDHWGELFELVAVLDEQDKVKRIMKRRVPKNLIIRNKHLVEQLQKKSFELSTAASAVPVLPDPATEISYDIAAWELHCPFSSSKFLENYSAKNSRNQMYFFPPPIQHTSFGRAYATPALWAYQVATFSLTWKSVFHLESASYSQTNIDPDPFERWKLEKQETAKIGLLRFIRGDKDQDGVLVLPGKYKRLNTKVASSRLFRFYYLDYGLSLKMEISYSIKHDASLGTTDYFTQKISQIQMNVDNSNQSLIQVGTEKHTDAKKASVKFILTLGVIKSNDLRQNHPGDHLVSTHIVLNLIGGFGKCVSHSTDTSLTDSLSTLIHVGCKPSVDLLFNWNKTLHSIAFRDKDAHFGGPGDCYNDEYVCFYSRKPLILYFDVFDVTKQTYTPYHGNYVLRIVGGGYTKDGISRYTKEEIEAYNIPGVSDVSLIWNEWDLEKRKKVDHKPAQYDGTKNHDVKRLNRETVLTSGVSAIQWTCHTLSPCARIGPNIKFQTVYWFKIAISNKDVDNSTLCLYEKEFDIMLYGFPPSPEVQLLTTILFCLCLLGILYLLFICCRSHKRLWRATKIKTYGWYQIVKDTFPKALKTQEEQGADEGKSQQQKDNIILSLQGHLKIPPLAAREGESSAAEQDHDYISQRSDSIMSRTSSLQSIRSDTSFSQHDIARSSSRGGGPTTWVDLVYEQIISKRLAAIVEKNKKLRSNILKKTGSTLSASREEKKYAKEHKQTVADESTFVSKPKPPPKRK